jgi:anti-sigma regulatory factor (Ser/Thr protein kinase)
MLARPRVRSGGFRHDALLYASDWEFLSGTVPFVRNGLRADEAVLAILPGERLDLLRSALGEDADAVQFADMDDVGGNPARIIPAWRDFVADHVSWDRGVRGIGEPVHPKRTAAEVDECRRHESLINVAFGEGPAWQLLCPYDTTLLDPAVIDHARRSHPRVRDGHREVESSEYHEDQLRVDPFQGALPDPPGHVNELWFEDGPLHDLRGVVAHHAARAGLDRTRVADLVLAANETAANSVRHGGGGGRLRVWQDNEELLCEVEDAGRIIQPLVGRVRPSLNGAGGRGLWLANQVCDLVQIRSSAAGTVVRLHMRRTGAARPG